MEQNNYTSNLLFELPSTKIVEYKAKKIKPITEGHLGVYQIEQLGLYIIKVNDWEYPLNDQIPVMKEQNRSFNQHVYVMPTEGGHFGISIENSVQQGLLDCWESILHQHSNFVVPDQEHMVQEAVKCGAVKHEELEKSLSKENQQDEEEEVTSSKIGAFIHLGGDYIRQGLISGAKLVSKGIKAGGQFIQTKITTPKKVEVDESTMRKVRGANTTSKIMLQYSRAQIEALYGALKTAAKEVGKEVQTTEFAQNAKKNEHYDDVKNVAKGTVHAFAAIYDGCFEALCEIGRGFSDATVGVVQKQYGDGAGEATKQGLGVVGNVGYIVKSTQDVVVKDVVKETKDQQYDGVKPQLQ